MFNTLRVGDGGWRNAECFDTLTHVIYAEHHFFLLCFLSAVAKPNPLGAWALSRIDFITMKTQPVAESRRACSWKP